MITDELFLKKKKKVNRSQCGKFFCFVFFLLPLLLSTVSFSCLNEIVCRNTQWLQMHLEELGT